MHHVYVIEIAVCAVIQGASVSAMSRSWHHGLVSLFCFDLDISLYF